MLSFRPLFTAFATITAAGLFLSGCETPPPRGRGVGTGGAPMTSSGELAQTDPKPMDAQAAFFAEQLTAEAMLAKSDVEWRNPAGPEGGRGGRGAGGFRGGLGGGGGGGRRGGGSRGGGERRGGGEGSAPAESVPANPRGPAIRASNAQPVQLRLRLTNHGDQPVEVEVLDFNSTLGNFVVQPAKLTLPPGEPVETSPMLSRLGVPAVEEIPVTVRIRRGGKTGPSETQILKLRPRVEEAAPVAKPE